MYKCNELFHIILQYKNKFTLEIITYYILFSRKDAFHEDIVTETDEIEQKNRYFPSILSMDRIRKENQFSENIKHTIRLM